MFSCEREKHDRSLQRGGSATHFYNIHYYYSLLLLYYCCLSYEIIDLQSALLNCFGCTSTGVLARPLRDVRHFKGEKSQQENVLLLAMLSVGLLATFTVLWKRKNMAACGRGVHMCCYVLCLEFPAEMPPCFQMCHNSSSSTVVVAAFRVPFSKELLLATAAFFVRG